MNQSFLNAARLGKNDWWRYLISTILIIFSFAIIGSIILFVIFLLSLDLSNRDLEAVNLTTELDRFIQSSSLSAYAAVNMSALCGAIGLLLTIRFIHKRKLASLVRFDLKVRWKRMLAAFGVWWGMISILSAIDLWLHPSNYRFFPPSSSWLLFLLLASILTPIQTSFEELLFRGYCLQGMSLKISSKFMLVAANGILFMLPHLANPEMARGGMMFLYYLAFGVFATVLTIQDDGLELALGLHAANNLQQVLFFNSADSVLPGPSLWVAKVPNEPIVDIVFTLVLLGIFYYIFLGRGKKPELG
jgi:uncharacterized protein